MKTIEQALLTAASAARDAHRLWQRGESASTTLSEAYRAYDELKSAIGLMEVHRAD